MPPEKSQALAVGAITAIARWRGHSWADASFRVAMPVVALQRILDEQTNGERENSNLDHLPSTEFKIAAFRIYRAIKEEPELAHLLTRFSGQLLGGGGWSWRVVGISEIALKRIAENNFKRCKKLHRAHFIQDRETTYKMISNLDLDELSFTEWWNLYWKNDATVIVSASDNEHSSKLDDVKCFKIDWKLGLFQGARVGYKFRKGVEGEYLRKCVETGEMDLSEPAPFTVNDLKSWSGIL